VTGADDAAAATPPKPDANADAAPAPQPLTQPRAGLPALVTTPEQLDAVVAAFAAGTGPVAADTERASGYRYFPKAYLVQLRRAGAGTALVDPVALPDLTAVSAAVGDVEWVLHAASQDLAALREVGLAPRRLFDTELAGRLLGRPRVGLASLVAEELGFSLAKEHSAVNWSTRPLPAAWLTYAALDVELLLELRDALADALVTAGKDGWAREEFEAVLDADPPPPREQPWRRLRGIHRVRSGRGLAVARAVWEERDRVARRRDLAPSRILPDAAIVEAAVALPGSVEELGRLPGFRGRGARGGVGQWYAAVERGLADPVPIRPRVSGEPPPARAWAERDPAAAQRLARARAGLAEVSRRRAVPVEQVLAPDVVRQLAWRPPQPSTPDTVATRLRALGARPWQVDLTVPLLVAALDGTGSPLPTEATGE
jgi:ribonuclease D